MTKPKQYEEFSDLLSLKVKVWARIYQDLKKENQHQLAKNSP